MSAPHGHFKFEMAMWYTHHDTYCNPLSLLVNRPLVLDTLSYFKSCDLFSETQAYGVTSDNKVLKVIWYKMCI